MVTPDERYLIIADERELIIADEVITALGQMNKFLMERRSLC